MRCSRASAECVTSPQLPMGRPSHAAERARRRSVAADSSRPGHARNASLQTAKNSNMSKETRVHTLPPQLAPLTQSLSNEDGDNLSSPTDFNFQSWTPQDTEMTHEDPTLDETHNNPSLSWTLSEPHELYNGIVNLETPGGGQSLPTMAIDPSLQLSDPDEPVTRYEANKQRQVRPSLGEELDFGRREPNASDGYHPRLDKAGKELGERQGDHVQLLSELTLRLNGQLQDLHARNGEAFSRPFEDISGSHVTRILRSSQELLSALLNLHHSSSQAIGLPTSRDPIFDDLLDLPNEEHRTRQERFNARGATSSASECSGSTRTSPSPPSSSSNFGSAMTSSPQRPDTTFMLLSITCYLQIVRIFGTVLAHVDRHLRGKLPEATRPVLLFPGLNLGGFPLQSSNLQATVLVHVVVHLLARIEKLLGIPMEHRVARSDGRNSNVVEDSGMTELFRTIARHENFEDKRSLSEQIRAIKHTLRNSLPL